MIGDKRLEMPKTIGDAIGIILNMGLQYHSVIDDVFTVHDAKKLVELNNEVYDKTNSCETCKRENPGIDSSDYCRVCGKDRRDKLE